MALVADRAAADAVTRQGRAILDGVVAALRAAGMALIEADTDGVFFAAPVGWSEAEERAVVAGVAATLPSGLRLEYEGRYQAMFSHEVKNYALLTYSGQVIVRGVALRSRRGEPFGAQFLEAAVGCTLRGDIGGLQQVYQATVAALRARAFPATAVATRARLTKTPAEYAARRGQLREGPYEALLAAGRTSWEVGEIVAYYRAEGGHYRWLPDPSGTPMDEGEGPEAAEAAESAATLPERDYDVGHYLRVFHATYVARLRKAFRAADFAQVFRADGQVGLFDQPLSAIAPIRSEVER
jgi:DNA polymerase elongation subunit (family B)